MSSRQPELSIVFVCTDLSLKWSLMSWIPDEVEFSQGEFLGFSGNWDCRFSDSNWWNSDLLVHVAEVMQPLNAPSCPRYPQSRWVIVVDEFISDADAGSMDLVFCRRLKWSQRLIVVTWSALRLFTTTGWGLYFSSVCTLHWAAVVRWRNR